MYLPRCIVCPPIGVVERGAAGQAVSSVPAGVAARWRQVVAGRGALRRRGAGGGVASVASGLASSRSGMPVFPAPGNLTAAGRFERKSGGRPGIVQGLGTSAARQEPRALPARRSSSCFGALIKVVRSAARGLILDLFHRGGDRLGGGFRSRRRSGCRGFRGSEPDLLARNGRSCRDVGCLSVSSCGRGLSAADFIRLARDLEDRVVQRAAVSSNKSSSSSQ